MVNSCGTKNFVLSKEQRRKIQSEKYGFIYQE
jgi:hypothetical protein